MREGDVCGEVEEVLLRLMPVGLSRGVCEELEASFDELGGAEVVGDGRFRVGVKWLAGVGVAAGVMFGVFLGMKKDGGGGGARGGEGGVSFLEEADRVEEVSDDGLYVDAGGSAVRRLRVRVVEESRMRDEETGIVVNLTAPREETYLLPISTF